MALSLCNHFKPGKGHKFALPTSRITVQSPSQVGICVTIFPLPSHQIKVSTKPPCPSPHTILHVFQTVLIPTSSTLRKTLKRDKANNSQPTSSSGVPYVLLHHTMAFLRCRKQVLHQAQRRNACKLLQNGDALRQPTNVKVQQVTLKRHPVCIDLHSTIIIWGDHLQDHSGRGGLLGIDIFWLIRHICKTVQSLLVLG